MSQGEELQYKELLMKAKEKAMRVMVASMKSQKQIISLLEKEGYEESIIKEVVDFLEGYGFLDDKALAGALVKTGMESRRYSKRQTMQKMMERGISKEDIRESMEDLDEEKELENALYLGRKKFTSLSGKPLRERLDKTGMSLSYKGFSYEVIRKTLNVLRSELKEEEE